MFCCCMCDNVCAKAEIVYTTVIVVERVVR